METAMSEENRESFFARFKPIYSEVELRKLELVYLLAKKGHAWQTRQEIDAEGKPLRYFEHLRRVALIAFDEAGCADSDLIIAAFLHDSLEDTRDLTPELLEHCFGPVVVRIVKQVSKVPKEGYLERLQKYGCWHALLLKACDRLDNLRSLDGTDDLFKRKQATETRQKYFDLFDRMANEAPVQLRAGALKVRDEIRARIVALEALLALAGLPPPELAGKNDPKE